MTKAQISLQNARNGAKTWHKVLEISDEVDFKCVTVVRGLTTGEDSTILAEKLKFAKSPELDVFLASPEIQQKLFCPSKRGIILIDIAGYSKFDTKALSAILTMFYESLKVADFGQKMLSSGSKIDQIVPTGDGCFIVYDADVTDRILSAVFAIQSSFYCHQKKLLWKNKISDVKDVFGIRIACHIGEIDFITDSAGNRNAYGVGLNETARILQCGRATLNKVHGEDPVAVVFFSSELDKQAENLIIYFPRIGNNEIKHINLGKVKTKHDLEMEIRCFIKMPNHIAFTFDRVA